MPTKEYLETHTMKEHSKAFMESHKGVYIPNEAHEWLQKRAGEIQVETGTRVSMGDVLLDVIRAIEDYENTEVTK